jgi:hypothetical protein
VGDVMVMLSHPERHAPRQQPRGILDGAKQDMNEPAKSVGTDHPRSPTDFFNYLAV